MGTIIAQQGFSRFLVVEVPEKDVTVKTEGYVVDGSSDPPVVHGPCPVQVFLKWGYWERYDGPEERAQEVLKAYERGKDAAKPVV